MHPILFNLGPLVIHTYGFFVAMGFIAGVMVVRNLAIQDKLNAERIIDLTFWLLLTGFAGARLLFVITRWSDFADDPLRIFKIWEGGLVFYGALFTTVPFAIWYMRKHNLPVWKSLDAMIPGLVIAHMFGRFGCTAAGCCYGRPTGTSFGIRLNSSLVEESYRGILLHPVQLYEAFALFLIFIGLLMIWKRKKFDGQVFLAYFMSYAVVRSVLEVFRGDLIRGFVIDDILSTSQFISLIFFVIALLVFIIRAKKAGGKG